MDSQFTIRPSSALLEKGLLMFNQENSPFTEKAFMHLKHSYEDSKFKHVTQAFLQKYNQKNSYSTITICHVEQLDQDRFQFVRRMENISTSKPLYDKIIVDRRQMSLQGFTYEKPGDSKYSEHYIYQDLNGTVDYSMFLFRDPGWKSRIRTQCHHWGVQSLQKLIKEKQDALITKAKEGVLCAKEKKDQVVQTAKDHKDTVVAKAKDTKEVVVAKTKDNIEHAKELFKGK